MPGSSGQAVEVAAQSPARYTLCPSSLLSCLSINQQIVSNIHGTATFAGTALHLQKPNRCRVSAATRSAEATSTRHTDRLASIKFLEQKSNHSWHRRAKYGTLLYGIAVGKPDGDGGCQEGIEVRRVGFSLGCAP